MNNRIFISLIFLAVACDKSGDYLVPVAIDGYPSVLEIGELEVIAEEDWEDPYVRPEFAYYGDIGAPEGAFDGGATFTFKGTGDKVCVVVDPEAIFWNQSVKPDPVASYAYPDNYQDDGDLDLLVGLSANYTGSPGIELGDFRGQYTDSLGNTVEIEYDLCVMTDYFGETPAHAGRATPEYCTINTEGREGIEYTVVLKTFSTPIDDSILSFATAVYAGRCQDIDECTLTSESPKDGFEAAEQAYCATQMGEFCQANPDWCGDPE